MRAQASRSKNGKLDCGLRRRVCTYVLAVCFVWAAAHVTPADAYRPFDGTDAAVADEHEFELELGPLGYLREGPAKSLIVPAVVANYGLGDDRELVLEGKVVRRIGDIGGEARTSLVDDALSIKQVLRRGVLQDLSGVSIATECGVLLPTIHAESGTGGTCALIGSQRWSAVTMHLNGALTFTRDHHWSRFIGLITEGPADWTVRPAVEVLAENEVDGPRTRSALVGLIWRASETLAFDVGARYARSDDVNVREIRAGLTWTPSAAK